MGRREKGEGSIYFDKRNNCYAASFWTEAGKRKYLYASIKGEVPPGRKEVKVKLEEAMRQDREGTLVVSSTTTLAIYLRDWLETISLRIRASSYPTWKNHIEIHLIPAIGGYKLQQLRPEHIQKRLITVLIKKELANSTIKEIYKVLKHALSDAVKTQKLSVSPCRNIVLPTDDGEEDGENIQVLSHAHITAVFEYLARRKHPREAMFVAMITTGMRSGEVRGLQWADVHLDDKSADGAYIAVNRTVVYIPGQGYIVNRTKSKSGKRKIPLTDYTAAKLRVYKAEQTLKGTWNEDGLVFPGEEGNYYSKSALRAALDRLIIRLELPILRVHDLRHTAATEMLISGMNLESVRKIMGHSSIQMTLRYVHFLGDTLKLDVQKYSAYLDARLA